MRLALLSALFLCCAAPVLAQEGPSMGPDDGGMDSKPRAPQPPKPIKRERFDKVVTAMFREGDTNHDGMVSIAELNARIEARRDEIVRARFTSVDSDRSGTISLDEFSAWQKRMGSAALNDAAALGGHEEIIPDSIPPRTGDDPGEVMLGRLIEPLNATVVARANSNYDAGASLEELLAYEGQRFDAADTNKDGYLTIDELRAGRRDGPRPGGPRPGGPRPQGDPEGERP